MRIKYNLYYIQQRDERRAQYASRSVADLKDRPDQIWMGLDPNAWLERLNITNEDKLNVVQEGQCTVINEFSVIAKDILRRISGSKITDLVLTAPSSATLCRKSFIS